MKYRIIFSTPASEEVRAIIRHLRKNAPAYAGQWVRRFEAAAYSLRTMPQRCPLAPENEGAQFEIRQILFDSYRVVFTVIHSEVRLLHVLHSRQDVWKEEE